MAPSLRARLSQRHNLKTLRAQPLAELSGALGDLGTLLPLLIALTLTRSISLPSTLVFTGLANILTGLFFSVPIPVQPMKAVAAVAIARNFSVTETMSAGLLSGGVVLALSLTGLMKWVGRIVPIPVVKGIQVGSGLTLVVGAGDGMLRQLGWTRPGWSDNWIWALAAFILLLITTRPTTKHSRAPRVPYALIVFITGLIIALIVFHDKRKRNEHFFSIWHPRTYVPSPRAFRSGALKAGIGQIPLTILNSVIAVTHLSAELLPSPPNPPAPSFTALGISVGVMNMVSLWFGSMPVCHGSGGLAGQYKFGARSGASIIVLGIVKLLLGLFVSGKWLLGVLAHFPKSLLGIMVVAAGVELARVGEGLNAGASDLWDADDSARERFPDETERVERWTVMMFTVAGILAFKDTGVGFATGLLCHWSLRTPSWWEKIRRRVSSERGASEEREGLLS